MRAREDRDADCVGVLLDCRLDDLLRESGAEDVLVVVGGTIPTEDADELKKQGVAEVFGPGAPTSDIVDFLKGAVPA